MVDIAASHVDAGNSGKRFAFVASLKSVGLTGDVRVYYYDCVRIADLI